MVYYLLQKHRKKLEYLPNLWKWWRKSAAGWMSNHFVKHSKCKLAFLHCFSCCMSTSLKSPVHFSNAISIICNFPKFPSILNFEVQLGCVGFGWVFFHTDTETPSVVESVHVSFHLCLALRNGCTATFSEAQSMFERHHEKL